MRKSQEKSGQRLPILCSGAAQELWHFPVVSARAIWQPNLGLAMNFADTDPDLLTWLYGLILDLPPYCGLVWIAWTADLTWLQSPDLFCSSRSGTLGLHPLVRILPHAWLAVNFSSWLTFPCRVACFCSLIQTSEKQNVTATPLEMWSGRGKNCDRCVTEKHRKNCVNER